MTPAWKPKPTKNRFKGDLKCDQFFDGFGNDFLERLVAKLGPTWEPKPSQNGAKLDPKSKQVGAWFENLLFEGCRPDFL